MKSKKAVSRKVARKVVKLAPRKVVKGLVEAGVIGKRVPLASLAPVFLPPVVPAPAPAPVVTASLIDQTGGNRAWFQMAKDKDGVIDGRIARLKKITGKTTLNQMVAEMFDDYCAKYKVM